MPDDITKKNYYEAFGIPRDATPEQVKAAYLDIARVYHPDSQFYQEIVGYQPSEDQVSAFKFLTDAYNTLRDPKKRERYDLTLPKDLPNWESPSPEEVQADEGAKKKEKVYMQQRPVAWGKFGSSTPPQEDEEEEELAPLEVTSVQEIMRRKTVQIQRKQQKQFALWASIGAVIVVVLALVLFLVLRHRH